MIRRTLLSALLVCFAANCFLRETSAQSPLKAGAATSNITPPLGEMVVGGFVPFPAKTIHDELHVRTIVLDDGRDKISFSIVDSVGVPREVFDRAKKMIEEKTGIPKSHQLMSATHTHSATSSRSENMVEYASELHDYQKFLAHRIADSVQIALSRMQPAKLAWGSVEEPSQLFNRRWFVLDEIERRNPFGGVDQVRMNPSRNGLIRQAGPIDPQVSFVSVQALDGRPLAVLANYSLHYVGGVADAAISADYFGYFAHHLGKMLGASELDPPFVGIMTNGTSGDVNNNNYAEPAEKKKPYAKMQFVGELIASRVHEAMKGLKYREQIDLDARAVDFKLKIRKPDSDQLAYVKGILAKPADAEKFYRHERIYAERVMQLAKSPDEVEIVLQTLKIGDLGIAAIPFEVFTETGLAIKEKSPFQPSFTIELANGSYGYLPTPPQHKLGGYETWLGTNKVEIEASEKIVSQLMSMFDELKP